MTKWTDIGSDVNWREYGGNWARHIDGTRYHVIRFINMVDACGRDATDTYLCELVEVDTTSDRLADALDSSDGQLTEQDVIIGSEWKSVEALSSYGAYAPLWQYSGENAHAIVREAKRQSRYLCSDAMAYEARMDRPVNAIGSTAREYAAGDMLSGILRGVAQGDPRAELMLKMGVRYRFFE